MDKAKILKLTFFLVFMALNPKMIQCQTSLYPSSPLCMTEFALANHACGLLPYSPLPPHPSPPHPPSPVPPPPCPPDHQGDHDHCGGDDDHDKNRHGHRRRHRHRHRRHHHESSMERDCCRWLKEMDEECVCDLLVRLPPFLSKPGHAYTVIVDESCHVTFECEGRLRV